MQHDIFYGLGKLVYYCRWFIILLAFILVVCCIPFIPNIIKPFNTTGFTADKAVSTTTDAYIGKKLGFDHNRFLVLYTGKSVDATSTSFNNSVKDSLAGLKKYPVPTEIIYPVDNKDQVSKDKRAAYAVIIVKKPVSLSEDELNLLTSMIKKPAKLEMKIGGEPLFLDAVNNQTQSDLFHADMIAAPLSIVTLIIVFGSVIAAILPIVLGGGCALLILTALYFFGNMFSLSIFTLNIAMLLGLCLSLDYSLFMINRFRQELRDGKTIIEAIATTQATAGKAVFFSGLAVFISLSALLLFPINILFSVGVGGLTAVFVAVTGALFLLPSVLSVLGEKINLLPVKIIKVDHDGSSPFWNRLVTKVVAKPWLYFISIMLVLALLSYPFVHVKFGISDFRIFPQQSEGRAFFDLYKKKFNEEELLPIQVVIRTTDGTSILEKQNIARLYEYSKVVKAIPSVSKVFSIVNTTPALTKDQYQMLYKTKYKSLNKGTQQLLDTTTKDDTTVVSVVSKYPSNSPQTASLIRALRAIYPGGNMVMDVTGESAINLDVFDSIKQMFPYAILWIMSFTFIILVLLLRSIFLPIKALIMTILSLCASYGVLVFIIQDGHFSQYLNFDPQGMLDISLLIIIFCALFGFSMDYEVFLLSRIKECQDKTHDNKTSIIFGVEQSSRIITSAAIIVILLCASFMVADVLMIKAFGLGIAVAIFTDAFLIRSILVPAVMTIMGKWNWYFPQWLDKNLPKL